MEIQDYDFSHVQSPVFQFQSWTELQELTVGYCVGDHLITNHEDAQ